MADYAESISVRAKRPGKKELDHIRISPAENGGHIAEHHFTSEGGGYHQPETHVFGDGEGQKMLEHIAKHLGIKGGAEE